MSLPVSIALAAASLVVVVLLVALALGHRHHDLAHAPEDEEERPFWKTLLRKLVLGFMVLLTLFGASFAPLASASPQPPIDRIGIVQEQRRELSCADALADALGGELDPAIGLPEIDAADRPRCEALLRRLDGHGRELARLAVEDADADAAHAAERLGELAEAVRCGEIDGRWALPWLTSAEDLPSALDELHEIHRLTRLGERGEAARSIAEIADEIERLLHKRAEQRRTAAR